MYIGYFFSRFTPCLPEAARTQNLLDREQGKRKNKTQEKNHSQLAPPWLWSNALLTWVHVMNLSILNISNLFTLFQSTPTNWFKTDSFLLWNTTKKRKLRKHSWSNVLIRLFLTQKPNHIMSLPCLKWFKTSRLLSKIKSNTLMWHKRRLMMGPLPSTAPSTAALQYFSTPKPQPVKNTLWYLNPPAFIYDVLSFWNSFSSHVLLLN